MLNFLWLNHQCTNVWYIKCVIYCIYLVYSIFIFLLQLILYMSRELWYLLHTLDCRNAHSVMSMKWLRAIAESGMPALICLTFADRLFAEQMTKNKEYPHPEVVRTIISDHMQVGHLMQSIVQTIMPKSFSLWTVHLVGLQGEILWISWSACTRMHDVLYSYQQWLHTRGQRGPSKTSWRWNQRSRRYCSMDPSCPEQERSVWSRQKAGRIFWTTVNFEDITYYWLE